MDKKAFLLAKDYIKRNPLIVIGMIVVMFLISFGEQAISSVLTDADLQYVDYGVAVVRMILQSALSTVLVYTWYKQKDKAAPFSAVDILKLFVASLITTIAITFCIVLIVLLPLGIFLYLRWDFFMNRYITGKSNGIFSCIGSSFRMSKGFGGKYFVFNLKYLSFYFIIEVIITICSLFFEGAIPAGVYTAMNIFDMVFLSVFMPYRFLVKCGFYDVYFGEER